MWNWRGATIGFSMIGYTPIVTTIMPDRAKNPSLLPGKLLRMLDCTSGPYVAYANPANIKISKKTQMKDVMSAVVKRAGERTSMSSYIGSTHIWIPTATIIELKYVILPLEKPNMQTFFAKPFSVKSQITINPRNRLTMMLRVDVKPKYFNSRKHKGSTNKDMHITQKPRICNIGGACEGIIDMAASVITIMYPTRRMN